MWVSACTSGWGLEGLSLLRLLNARGPSGLLLHPPLARRVPLLPWFSPSHSCRCSDCPSLAQLVFLGPTWPWLSPPWQWFLEP